MKGLGDEETIIIENKPVHKSCYKCKVCDRVPDGSSYVLHMGKLYCFEDSKRQVGTGQWLNEVFLNNRSSVLNLKNCCIFDPGAFTIAERIKTDESVEKLDISRTIQFIFHFLKLLIYLS